MSQQNSENEQPEKLPLPNEGEIIFYKSPGGSTKLEVFYKGDTFWLSQKKMAELYGVERSVITKHIGNIFKSKELEENSVCANIAHTAQDRSFESDFDLAAKRLQKGKS